MSEITIPSKDGGSFTAYVAEPDTLPAPVVVVIQEIFGVNQEMRTKCDDLAKEGFIAVCPDIFWRLEPGIQLTDKSEEEWQKAFDLYNRFDVDQGIEDLRATEHAFKGHAHSTGRVGCVGYCLGGKLAYLMATRTNVDCAISYYGVGLEDLLEESINIKNPLMLHIAEDDKFVSPEAQQKIKENMEGGTQVSIYSYPGVDHAFARGNGENYNESAAALAHSCTMDFLKANLNGAKAA